MVEILVLYYKYCEILINTRIFREVHVCLYMCHKDGCDVTSMQPRPLIGRKEGLSELQSVLVLCVSGLRVPKRSVREEM